MGIGPTLPPHLQAKAGPGSDSDDDSYGPAPPKTAAAAGPSLPPHLQAKAAARVSEEVDQDEEDDGFAGPALPPHLAARRAGPSPAVSGPQRPSVGPSRPPGSYQGPAMPERFAPEPEDDSSDDDIGPRPSLNGAQDDGYSAVRDFEEREARWAKEREEAAKPKKLQREEWMLKPPEASDLLSRLDPSVVPRGQTAFNRVSAAPVKKEDQSLWTETPAERMERLKDEVSGKRKRAETASRGGPKDEDEADEIRRRKRRDQEVKQEIDAHNSKNRSKTLVELHSEASSSKAKDGSAPPPIWDRDLHMSVGGRLMDDKDRKAQLLDAKGLSSRFGHSSKSGAFGS